jgi:hypothetical protein
VSVVVYLPLTYEDASTDDRSLLQRVQAGKSHDYKEYSDLDSFLHSTILRPKETSDSVSDLLTIMPTSYSTPYPAASSTPESASDQDPPVSSLLVDHPRQH